MSKLSEAASILCGIRAILECVCDFDVALCKPYMPHKDGARKLCYTIMAIYKRYQAQKRQRVFSGPRLVG